jgi:hypothetical protein
MLAVLGVCDASSELTGLRRVAPRLVGFTCERVGPGERLVGVRSP